METATVNEAQAVYWVPGRPATFETNGEPEWKRKLGEKVEQADTPEAKRSGGADLSFKVDSLKRNGHRFDLDNLCEPVFAVVVRERGWFGGERRSLRWFRASREVARTDGCRVALWPGCATPPPDERWDALQLGGKWPVVFEGAYDGPLPKDNAASAASRQLARWIAASVPRQTSSDDLAVRLRFGRTVTIANITSGATKLVIDGLYPLLGGVESRPEDHRISMLEVVQRAGGVPPDVIRIEVLDTAGL